MSDLIVGPTNLNAEERTALIEFKAEKLKGLFHQLGNYADMLRGSPSVNVKQSVTQFQRVLDQCQAEVKRINELA